MLYFPVLYFLIVIQERVNEWHAKTKIRHNW